MTFSEYNLPLVSIKIRYTIVSLKNLRYILTYIFQALICLKNDNNNWRIIGFYIHDYCLSLNKSDIYLDLYIRNQKLKPVHSNQMNLCVKVDNSQCNVYSCCVFQ